MSKKKRENYICNQLGIKLKSYDPNSYRDDIVGYSQMGDCTTCCICRLTNESYDTIYKMQTDIMIKNHVDSIQYESILSVVLNIYGYKGYNYRISLAEFMHIYKKGRYCLLVNNHAISYINGIWYDRDGILEVADSYLPYKINGVYMDKESEKYFKIKN